MLLIVWVQVVMSPNSFISRSTIAIATSIALMSPPTSSLCDLARVESAFAIDTSIKKNICSRVFCVPDHDNVISITGKRVQTFWSGLLGEDKYPYIGPPVPTSFF